MTHTNSVVIDFEYLQALRLMKARVGHDMGRIVMDALDKDPVFQKALLETREK